MNRILTAAAFATLILAACTKDEPGAPVAAAKPEAVEAKKVEVAAEPGGTQVADFPVSVELPAGAEANDPMGSPGFHSADGAISVLIGKQSPDSPKEMKAQKAQIEEFAFKKWVKSDVKPDGWILTWVGIGMDMDGKEYENFVFEQVKKIGDQTWRCSGSVKKATLVDANLKLCASLKATN